MKTPVRDFIDGYRTSSPLRLHMPGHKGVGETEAEAMDLTEIEGADVLYAPRGILRESQENAASLFGTAKTLYSTEGSSLSIRAMLYLTMLWARERGRAPLILAARNVHRSFVSAAALLDLEVEWLLSRESDLLSCTVTPEALERRLGEMETPPAAVYLTSPDYLGNRADIRALATVCHTRGVLLLVDNAHGAYLRFLPRSEHPIILGADACCDSAHKTLSALTGAGYLHIAHGAPTLFSEQAERAMSLFASTSPSYLILRSLDALNASLGGGYPGRLAAFAARVAELKGALCRAGYSLVGEEPLKLTVAAKPYGYLGTELSGYLAERGIVCEFADRDYLVAMLTPEIGDEELARLERAFLCLPGRKAIIEPVPPLPMPQRVLSMREATMMAGEEKPVVNCVGRILADATLSCPPAVPILVCGERITKEAVDCFRYYGITHIRVV